MEFSPASIAYDFRTAFKAAFRMTATKRIGGIPIHFEVIYVHSGFDRKVKKLFIEILQHDPSYLNLME